MEAGTSLVGIAAQVISTSFCAELHNTYMDILYMGNVFFFDFDSFLCELVTLFTSPISGSRHPRNIFYSK